MRKVIIAVALAGCAVTLMWMYGADKLDSNLVDKANVVGGLAGIVALVLGVLVLWPKLPAPVSPDAAQLDAALWYLARQTLSAWQRQAKERRITTSTPALVSWQWAGAEIATPAAALTAPDQPALLTAGEITRLWQLYDQLPAPAGMVILGRTRRRQNHRDAATAARRPGPP
ncbi:hypothetical protein ACQP2F_14555 [Actinoplanes sp. CA-030573]|uniref:hypothetical protein n=1 Tax=Actinoplanes sp. CA-030573 TaxID=3239898 RepID=UPI003D94A2C9